MCGQGEPRKTDLGEYADGMIEHDGHIGQLLDHLDKAGLSDNTIVLYTTDNGPMVCLLAGRWCDAVPAVRRTPTGRGAGVCRP